jgi:cytochrome c biogenesis factor
MPTIILKFCNPTKTKTDSFDASCHLAWDGASWIFLGMGYSMGGSYKYKIA